MRNIQVYVTRIKSSSFYTVTKNIHTVTHEQSANSHSQVPNFPSPMHTFYLLTLSYPSIQTNIQIGLPCYPGTQSGMLPGYLIG